MYTLTQRYTLTGRGVCVYRTPVKTSLLSCVKAPGLSDRKMGRIALILPILRSLNRGNFHAAQK
jgi:hypothetical protein